MTEEEIFLFDLRGYLVVQHALRPAAVDELNEALNAKIRTSVGTKIALQLEFPGLPYDAKVFRDLIDNPLITPYLSALLGERFRLDHDYGMVLRKGFPEWLSMVDRRRSIRRNSTCSLMVGLGRA